MPYRYLAPTTHGDGVLDDESDRRNRTTHMRLIGPVPVGQATIVHVPSGRVQLKPIVTMDEERDPDLLVLPGGREHRVDDVTAETLRAAGLGSFLRPE